jgi:Acyl-coenzyme A:6-aminopenicillanic acid acyl-transferase
MSNHDEVILGHTEDALPEFLNNVYIISAEITGDNGEKLEKFTTLTYAGHLPGYTMGTISYNLFILFCSWKPIS